MKAWLFSDDGEDQRMGIDRVSRGQQGDLRLQQAGRMHARTGAWTPPCPLMPLYSLALVAAWRSHRRLPLAVKATVSLTDEG